MVKESEEFYVGMIQVLLAFMVFSFLTMTLGGQTAFYGRYSTNRLGKTVNGRLDWYGHGLSLFSMAYVYFFLSKPECTGNLINLWLAALYILHYVNRSFIFGLRIKNPKPIPLVILCMTSGFCAVNGWLQAMWLMRFHPYQFEWMRSFMFVTGNILFFLGMYVNQKSDIMLTQLRKPGEHGYKIPRGFLFEYVSAPNFGGEIIEWFGFAMACGFTPPSAFFAVSTLLNIGK